MPRDPREDKFSHLCSNFPGIRVSGLGRRTQLTIQDDIATCELVTANQGDGVMAQLVIDYAAQASGVEASRQVGRRSTLTTIHCPWSDLRPFILRLRYASFEVLAEPLVGGEITELPLPTLLSHVLLMFKDDYDRFGAKRNLPGLPVLSNLLQYLGTKPIHIEDIRQKINISQRVLRNVVAAVSLLGWIEESRSSTQPRQKVMTLTKKGGQLVANGKRTIRQVESTWEQTYGENTICSLRSALCKVLDGYRFELPHYCVGYGVADQSIKGGSPHGEEWPNVSRDETVSNSELSLSALLSRTLSAYTIDYEMAGLGGLGWVSQCLQYIGDDPITLKEAREYGIVGNGKCMSERHLSVVVEPGRPSDGQRKVYLTPKSRRSRDAYPKVVRQTEQAWRDQYGDSAVTNLHVALEHINQSAPESIPDYPDPAHWLKYPQRTHQQPVHTFDVDPPNKLKWGEIAASCHAGLAVRSY